MNVLEELLLEEQNNHFEHSQMLDMIEDQVQDLQEAVVKDLKIQI